MTSALYLLPGRSNTLSDLGDIVLDLGMDVCGRELRPPFSTLRFSEQLAYIQKDLRTLLWAPEAKLIGHSYGGYLLLHALAELPPFPGRILLLSPVLGSAVVRGDRPFSSTPPRARRLLELSERQTFPAPRALELHTGADDDGCDPDLARTICAQISTATATVVPEQGHQLAPDYVAEVIRSFIREG
ncbi:alpha/beta hydrolase [Thiorhodococcus minor]|uniref:Alpha/beta hydrolase n=1 Tax=Thiorhodococcus minor TaxID=57489 RepID=A0A6M0JT12_9GAMM|nr:hypothetical protein [Thiorhodococcus minor]NEV60656.1 hypothetical protein [Thiorhodococcus minor]